ncbi:hypothetical protein K6119_12210 [Paracrocinitomix mangrovi]|uniref:hypothetical protein n=1 Tax=Paracrocinitomix mangrovi TaxID=2862509 RepID=UPI001C8E000E|nr:hypothetical protein [Paracrocinitomix mangrovi]UKN00495.1 hypothetical protein K6119_12210 [Paracrocinitomix mangrovi]
MKSFVKSGLFAIISFLFIFNLSACRREKPSVAKVLVVNTDGAPVSNAEVILFPNPDPQLGPVVEDDVAYTNADGYAIYDYTDDFNLGQAGFRLLDINVNAPNNEYGEGIIKVEPEKTTEVTVVVAPI